MICDPTPTDQELQKYYMEEFYASEKPDQINDSSREIRDRDSDFYHLQYSIFASLLDLQPGSTHVDLACGYGHFLSNLSASLPGIKLFGCEVFQEADEYVKRIPGATFQTMDLNDLSSCDELLKIADTISLINALEHLREPDKFLENCLKKMKHGAKLLLQVPNDFNPIQQVATSTLGLDEWWFCPPRHISYFTPDGLSNFAKDIGFKVVDQITTFPIDMLLISGLNYRKEPSLGRTAHEYRVRFENNYVKTHGVGGLIHLYRHLSRAGIGREIIIVLER